MQCREDKRGFTLVELLVVISVSVILTTMIIVYGRLGEEQLIVFKEQAKMIGVLNRAKGLATEKYVESTSDSEEICGYGIRFLKNVKPFKYQIFEDRFPTCDTQGRPYAYDIGDDVLLPNESHELSNRIANLIIKDGFGAILVANNPTIIFTAPNLDAKITSDNGVGEINEFYFEITAIGGAKSIVRINNAGQISSQ